MTPVGGPGGTRSVIVVPATSLTRKGAPIAQRMSIFDILSRSRHIEAIHKVSSSDRGIALSRELFGGKTVIGFQGFRTSNEDIIVFELEGNELAVARFSRGSIIALECSPSSGKRTIIGLREDISHRRLNLAMSLATGRDVTYLDPATVAGAQVINLSGEVAEIGLANPIPLSEMRPSWYTEDWLTVRFEDQSDMVIQADRQQMKAVQRHRIGGTTVIVFGPEDTPTPEIPPLPTANLPLLLIVKKG